MTRAHHARLLLLLSLLLAPGLAVRTDAGPWTPERGHGQVIFTGNWYETQESFDQDGDKQRYEFDGRFTKRELNPYIEFGLTDRLALIGNLFFSRQAFDNSFGRLETTGPGDTEIGLRYRLNGTSAPVIVAVQGLVKVPTADTDGEVALGNGQADIEMRLAIGGSVGGGQHPPFWNVDAGFRRRNGDPADEVRVDATFGAYLHPRIMLMAQGAAIVGMQNARTADDLGNPTLTPDYDLYRAQGSVVVQVARRLRLQGGAFAHVAGRNTGAGAGIIASAWLSF
jgi:hypothetical protein